MKEERTNQLMKKTLKRAFTKEGEIRIVSSVQYRRDVGKFAKESGISLQEAFDFINPLAKEMFTEMLDQSEFS